MTPFVGVDGGSLTSATDPSIQIAGLPGLALTREPQYDDGGPAAATKRTSG